MGIFDSGVSSEYMMHALRDIFVSTEAECVAREQVLARCVEFIDLQAELGEVLLRLRFTVSCQRLFAEQRSRWVCRFEVAVDALMALVSDIASQDFLARRDAAE